MTAQDQRSPGWVHLGKTVVHRRVELGFDTREAFASHVGLSARLIGDVENGRRRSYDSATYAKLEQALGWPQGQMLMAAEGRKLIHGPALTPLAEQINCPVHGCGWEARSALFPFPFVWHGTTLNEAEERALSENDQRLLAHAAMHSTAELLRTIQILQDQLGQ